MRKLFLLFVCATCAFAAGAQTYHEADKAALRAFLSQPSAEAGQTNGERLGLTASDMATWNTGENWVGKIAGLEWDLEWDNELQEWNFESPKRIFKIIWNYKSLGGNLDLSGCASLKYFWCDNNQLTILDVSKNTALIDLSCSNNQLTTLVSDNTALTLLQCNGNQLTTLDVSKNTALIDLNCHSNQLTTLDVSNNAVLTHLQCGYNQLTALDVSKNTALTHLNCQNASYNNQLSALDVSNNTALMNLYCDGNQLSALDISNNTILTNLSCGNNQLPALDVSNNTALTSLYCGGNQLTTLDVSKNTALTSLYCGGNQLTTLDVSKNTALTSLECHSNQLTTLDVNKNTTWLGCDGNQLTILDVSKSTELTWLSCLYNQLSVLDVSNNTVLTSLGCSGNQLTALDVSNNTALTTLYCNNNQLTVLDVSNNIALTSLGCHYNQLTALYCSGTPFSEYFYADYNAVPNLQCATCDLTGLELTNDFYDATADLCARTVLSGSVPTGSVNVGDPLKRSHLAKIAFRGLYLVNGGTIPAVGAIPADYYPSIYTDLNVQTKDNAYYFRAAKALLYLEYGDGLSPFDRNRTDFNPDSEIARADVVKVLLETFNIKPDLTNGANPFTDADVDKLKANNPLKFGYLRKAYDLGIITGGSITHAFRPFDACLRGEAFLMLSRLMASVEANTIAAPNLANAYFEPLNVTTANLSMGLGLSLGNFNHYTKTSFAISGVVPLSFAHTYNSYMTELPDEFFGMFNAGEGKVFTYKPLGVGWSHSYHTFVTLVNNKMMVHWGGGAIHVYGLDGNNFVCESLGVYDEASIANNIVTIKTKSQHEYRFKKNGTVASGVLELYSVKDRNGNELIINYETGQNGIARIKSVSDGQRNLTFSYQSGTNLVSQITDPLGRSIKFAYAFNAVINDYLLASFTDAKNQVTTYTYGTQTDAGKCKLLTKIQLPKGNYIENEYDANRRLAQSVAGVNGTPKSKTAVSVASDYQASGKSMNSTVKAWHDGVSSYDYNYKYNGNNTVTEVTGNLDLRVSAAYTNPAHATLPTSIETNNSHIESIQYDAKGNVTQITRNPKSNVGWGGYIETPQTVSMTYNSRNDVTGVTDARGNTTYYDYDNKGNLTKVRAPESSTTEYSVNDKGLVTATTNPEGIQVGFGYNQYGNLTATTLNALNLTSTAAYDNAGRLTDIKDFLNRESRFTYDNNDNLLTEVNALNHTTGYAYDANDNMTAITNAKGGVTSMSYDNTTDQLTSVSFGGATKQYAYNEDGSLKTFTKPDGTPLQNTYDDLGRIINDGVRQYTYNGGYRLASITKDGRTLNFWYEGFNRIKQVNYTGNGVSGFASKQVDYSYDANGNVTKIWLGLYFGNSQDITYTYDNLNRMKTATDWHGNAISYQYRKDSKLSSVTYPNGMVTTYTYDSAGRQTGKATKRSDGSVIASYEFTLDNAGNITQEKRTEPFADAALPSGAVNYTYNAANRITQAGDINFTIDANGNTTQRGAEPYSYDLSDKLTSFPGGTVEYDGMGHIRRNGTTRYLIDVLGMGHVLAEIDEVSGNVMNLYMYGATGLEARFSTGGGTGHYSIEYYVSDYRGSVVAMVDATTSANITHKYQYDEFGQVTQKEESDANPFRYVGKYGVMQFSDNLYYMRARFYDPTIGRFLSEDPIWSTNLYPYADNNPVMGIDPKGEDGELIEAFFLLEEKLILKNTSNTVLGKELTNEDGIDIIAKQALSTAAKLSSVTKDIPGVGVLTNAAYSTWKDLEQTGTISLETKINIAKDAITEAGSEIILARLHVPEVAKPYVKPVIKSTLQLGGDLGEKYLTIAQDDYIFPFLDKTVGPILFPNK